MKVAKFFAVIFAVLGVVLMLGTAVVCFVSLDASVKLLETPAGAMECADNLADAINAGDYTEAGKLLYGQPDLGVDRAPSDAMGAVIWDAFLESLSFELSGKCYASDEGICRNGTITALHIPSVTENLQTRFRTLLTARVNTASDMAELYDDENNFRSELVSEVLQEAVRQALNQDAQYVTYDVTLKLISRDGQWWVVPDDALLTAISGGVA